MAIKPRWYGQEDTGEYDWFGYVDACLGFKTDPQEQDWGTVHSDKNRIVEFIEFYYDHLKFEPICRQMIGELIFVSFDDALLADSVTPDVEKRMREFVLDVRHDPEQQTHFECFLNLAPGTPDDPYPLGTWIERVFAEQDAQTA